MNALSFGTNILTLPSSTISVGKSMLGFVSVMLLLVPENYWIGSFGLLIELVCVNILFLAWC